MRPSTPDRPLIGREALVEELVSAAEAAAAGWGSVVLLTGEAGIGKTSIARAVARRVRDDLAVSWGNCSADGSAPPFWPWRSVVDIEPTFAPDGDAPDRAIGAERFERLNGLRNQLIGHRHPRLHVVEDLEWADMASVLLLIHLSAAVSELPMMILATLRTGVPLARPLDEAIEEVRRAAVVRDIPQLPEVAIERLIREAGIEPDSELASVVRARTGGNPLFVTELLRAASTTDPRHRHREMVEGGVTARVTELISHQLSRLPDAVVALVVTAAVVGMEGDVRTLADIRGSSIESVVVLLEQARAAHLLDAAPPGRWQFRHALVHDAVYASVTDTVRAREHAAVLESLAVDAATPPAVLARHALAAQPMLDAERAVALAARAGEWAFAQHAYEEAVGWFESALDVTTPLLAPRWRTELLVLCGEAHRHMGDLHAARQAFLGASGLSAGPAPVTSTRISTSALASSTFRRAETAWEIDFAGRREQIPEVRGLRDLAFLLARPDQAVSVLELLSDTPMSAGAAVGAPAFDERARREIRDRLRELDAEVDEAEANNDLERAAETRERRQVLAETVARDLGLGGRPRRIGDPVERARKTVSTRIRRTIVTVGRTHPELGRHLDRSIDTGAWCAYRPAEPVSWIT